MRIKFSDFREKDIPSISTFFRMRLNASVYNANQRQINENKVNIRRFLSFFLLPSLHPGKV